MDLMVDVYEATRSFPRSELFGLTSQMRRAAGGVVGSIAEGKGRLTYGEWRDFLSRARGSLYEVEAQIIASTKLGFLTSAVAEHLRKQARIAGRELAGLINWVRRRESESKQLRQKPQAPDTRRPPTREP